MKIKLLSLLLAAVFLLAACSPAADTSVDGADGSDVSATPSADGDISSPDTENEPCITDESGNFGVVIDYKDTSYMPSEFGCILMQPTTVVPFQLTDDVYAVTVKRRVKGGFEVMESGIDAISKKYFTLIFKGEAEVEFAKQFLAVGKVCQMYNTDKVTQFGDGIGFTVGEKNYAIDALNPQNAADGISLYDEKYGFGVSPEYDGEFVDILVFDGYVVKKCDRNTVTVLPFPNGCLIRLSGDAVKYADGINEGDKVDAVGFEIECSPKAYVDINGKKVEIAYRNEFRSAVAYAVMYDSDYAYDSTRTNIWGVEVAVDRDGFITEVVRGNTEGVSGNTAIPEGGFVLSSGYTGYSSYMTSAKVGEKAEYTEKQGAYDYRRISDVLFNEYGTNDEEFISFITSDFASRTRQISSGIYCAIDSDGYVTEISDKPVDIPSGGCAIAARGVKKNELKRFCKVGDRVTGNKKLGCIFILRTVTQQTLAVMLSQLEADVASAAEAVKNIDYAAINTAISGAKTALENGDNGLLDAARLVSEAQKLLVPTLKVQERAAWVIDTDSDMDDVKRTVAYAKKLGLNTLILSPFRNNYALYDTKVEHLYRSKDLPELDVLQAYIDECHKNDIRLVFMLCCFIADLPSDKYEADHFVNYFGDRLLVSKTGRNAAYFYDDPSYTLDPYDSEIREFYKSIVKEVIANYDVDGIQLDYIRFPLPSKYGKDNYEDHGYNDDIVAAFKKQYRTKTEPKDLSIDDPLWDKWCSFRRDIITSFVKEVSRLCGDTDFSVTCFANYTDRQKYVFQDVEKWAEKGYIDAVYPMIYTASAEEYTENAGTLVDGIDGNCRVVLGIGTYDGETEPVLTEQLAYGESRGVDGISIFALQYIQSCHFDDFYKNAFRTPATRTFDTEKAVKDSYSELLSVINGVYGYVSDADLSELAEFITSISESFELKKCKSNCNKALDLMNKSSAPQNVKDDFAARISRIIAIAQS